MLAKIKWLMSVMPLVMFLLLVGCRISDSPTTLIMETAVIHTLSLPPTTEVTPTVMHIDIPQPTGTVSLTAPPTTSPTWTPLPTLEPDQAVLFVDELLISNGGCELPCWWGINPGETTWAEAKHFLRSFATRVQSEPFYRIRENDEYVTIIRHWIEYPISSSEKGATVFITKNEKINLIEIGQGTTDKHYALSQLLEKLGEPTQVYIETYPDAPDSFIPFRLILYYQEADLLAYYETNADVGPEIIRGCSFEVGPRLWLWSPNEMWTEYQILERTLGPGFGQPRQIDQVTNYTTETFYRTFIDPETPECIETPIEHWFDLAP